MNAQTSQLRDGAIVVGIGTNGWQSALRWAVRESMLRMAPLHLVHANGSAGGIRTQASKADTAEQSDRLVQEAESYARRLGEGKVQVSTEVDPVHAPADALVIASAKALLVVLQHRDLGLARRAIAGSVVSGVAARSHAPVVSVAERWRPGNETGVVTVAIQHPDEALTLLRAAGAAARVRNTDVRVLHAWWLDTGYDNVAVDDAFRNRHEDETRTWLDPVVASFLADSPGTTVTLNDRHAPPLRAILDAADGSGLLVVGRRHHRLPHGSHLGPVSRAVLDHVDTPVLVMGKPTRARR
jgi:nucleotide-binding universal stress UspA family protein